MWVKLADFETAVKMEKGKRYIPRESIKGFTSYYAAPELYEKAEKLTYKFDNYSCGVTFINCIFNNYFSQMVAQTELLRGRN